MSASKEQIFRSALELSAAERIDLIGALIDSLDSESEDGVEAAWALEIERRSAELESGAVASISWEEVKERLARARSG